jgi:CheY-like chemotaxis protein
VWMDMRMPGVSGIEATQQIKQSEWGAETVVIALTASAFEADEATARAAGCDDFLRKPLQLHQVFDKLTERLGVAYLYDDAPLLARVDATALHGLPAPWLSALEQACLQADVFTVARMIDFVRSQAPQAASVLSDMLEQYNYAAIIDLTRHALQAAGGGP